MAFTADDLTTLERAIAEGVLRVRFADGREVQYAGLEALKSARAFVAAQIAAAAPPGHDPLRTAGGVTVAEFTRA